MKDFVIISILVIFLCIVVIGYGLDRNYNLIKQTTQKQDSIILILKEK